VQVLVPGFLHSIAYCAKLSWVTRVATVTIKNVQLKIMATRIFFVLGRDTKGGKRRRGRVMKDTASDDETLQGEWANKYLHHCLNEVMEE